MTTAADRIAKMPLKADGVYVRGAADDYHVTTISPGMNDREDYARLFACAPAMLETLQALSEGIADIRQRRVIDEAQWLDDMLLRARAIIGNATPLER